MLRVLLVDDEYIVLKGMEAMLSEQTAVELQLFTSCDAVEALAGLDSIRPDVIIADINMPEMDGLSLIQNVQKYNTRCRFIICTGYDKVEYLHRAIRQQVAEYLLKPVDRTTLIEKLAGLDAHKIQEQEEILFLLKMCVLYHQGDALLDSADMQSLLPEKHYRLCTVAAENDTGLWQKRFSRYYKHVLLLHRHKNTVFLLGSEQLLTYEQAEEICMLVFTPNQHWGLSADMETADIHNGETLTEQNSYSQAMTDYAINLLPIDTIKRAHLRRSIIHFPSFLLLHTTDKESALQCLTRLTDILGSASMAFLRVLADSMTIELSPSSPWPATAAPIEIALTAQPDISDINCLYQETVRLLSSRLPRLCGQEEDTGNHSKADRAVSYIQQHYREDISLNLVAGHVALHPSYFSYWFKKETGEPFLKYLHTLRLEAACILMLEQPALSLETVGTMAGYRSAAYFHKAFRQRFGTSPREWASAQTAAADMLDVEKL